MIPSNKLSIDKDISTPEKYVSYDTVNDHATPDIMTKQSTPVDDFERKRSNPFLQDSKHPVAQFTKITDDTDITPLFKKLPKYNEKFNLASTPLNGKENVINEPIQFNFGKSNRNIFNLSPKLPHMQPDRKHQKLSDISTAVKDAFNTFDKSDNIIPSTNISRASFTVRKRKRTVKDVEDYENASTLMPKQIAVKNYLEAGTFRQILSDPQCISNLTIIVQIMLNSMLMLLFLGFGVVGFLTIKKDVDRKVATYVNEVIFSINSCKRNYFINNCAPELRAPALETKCNQWATCMEEDPEAVITSRAYFEVFADCLNAFFQNISLRTLCSLCCLLVFCIIIPNVLFTKFRSLTTINQNYYGQNHLNEEVESIQSPSSRRRYDKTALPRNIEGSRLSNGSNCFNSNPNTGVRFDPNVSYSFYECEDIKSDPDIGSIISTDLLYEEDAESDIGDKRIVLDI